MQFAPQASYASDKADALLAKVVSSLVQYIRFPSHAKGQEVLICTVGVGNIGEKINELKLKKIKALSRPDDTELKKCDMVYISLSEQNQFSETLWKIRPYHALTISNIEGFADAGGGIELVTEGRLSFRININAVKESKVSIGGDLLNIAEIVKK